LLEFPEEFRHNIRRMKEALEDTLFLLLAVWVSVNIIGAIAVQIWYYRLGI
tara:strand:- start:848 stop:1000 length:153 start_codon:yes stop_codon:yes gene_type:complete